MLMNEGNAKWYELPRTQGLLNSVTNQVPPQLFNETCSMLALFAYLADHKADTLMRVVDTVSAFATANNSDNATVRRGNTLQSQCRFQAARPGYVCR